MNQLRIEIDADRVNQGSACAGHRLKRCVHIMLRWHDTECSHHQGLTVLQVAGDLGAPGAQSCACPSFQGWRSIPARQSACRLLLHCDFHPPLDPKPEESKALPFIHGELQSQERNLHTRKMAVGSELCSSA